MVTNYIETSITSNYVLGLATHSTRGLISEIKTLHDLAYQLGVEEAREMTRGKYLKIFSYKPS